MQDDASLHLAHIGKVVDSAASGNPCSPAHQGTPRQFVDLPPGLDPLRAQHQEPHLAARLARVPVRLRGIPPGQAGRNLVRAVDLLAPRRRGSA